VLETLDLKPSLDRDAYATRRPNYDRELFDLVRRARAGGVPIVFLFEGTELAGKGRAIYTLTEKFDPRVATVHPIGKPRKFERERPWLWRFWMKLPQKGDISIFDESWYRRVLVERFEKTVAKSEWRAAFEEIAALERTLTDEGTVLVKLFLHIDRRTMRRRMKRIEERGGKILRAWREQERRFGAWESIVEDMLERTSTPQAPWTLVPACCTRFARAKVFETVITVLRHELDDRGVPLLAPPIAALPPSSGGSTTTSTSTVKPPTTVSLTPKSDEAKGSS
jgi:polyphosphate kinase 2 (PPK2 family)